MPHRELKENIDMVAKHSFWVAMTNSRCMLMAAATILVLAACVDPPPRNRPEPEPEREPEPPPPQIIVDTVVVEHTVTDTVTVSNPETEQEVARLQLRLMEREAQIEELQDRLDQATQEVVRSMARLQTNASRAEAASAMAEAEVALEQLKAATGGRETPETERVQVLLNSSTNAFNAGNFGGSLYLANQARTLARGGREGILAGPEGALLSGETRFTVALPLQTVRRSNVRQGPGTEHGIAFTLETGVDLTGHSHVGQWLRVSTDDGRTGWIFQSLVEARGGNGP